MKAVRRNREGVKKTARKVAARDKAIQRGHAQPPAKPGSKTSRGQTQKVKAKSIPAKPAQRERRIDPELVELAFDAGQEVQGQVSDVPLPVIAICGRPNVGKSTLFNKLTESRRSIVGDEPGITRDRIYGVVNWAGRRAQLVDTGGIIPDDPALIPAEIYRQARVALEESDLIVMVVDGRTELAAPDFDLARELLRSGKSAILAVNKIDSEQQMAHAENYRQLGFKTIVPISAEHSLGIGDLLDELFAALPKTHESGAGVNDSPLGRGSQAGSVHRTHGEFQQYETKVAIIGRPNVGKSTLLNAMTGTTRAIVSPIAGTTRDAVDEVIDYEGSRLRIIDTAGIRRKGKTTQMAEKLSVVMARRHLEAADLALLVIDATEGVTASDATIGGYAHESGRSVVIVINKWDLVTVARTDGKPPADRDIYTQQIRRHLKYLSYAPVVFVSASNGHGVPRLLQVVRSVAQERRRRITTGQMNRFLETLDFQRAGVPLSQKMRVYYMTQAAVAPPTFVLFTNRQVKLHFSFERFLENRVRAAFGFEGSPIWFKVRARKQKGAE